jgi:hypothetical protein
MDPLTAAALVSAVPKVMQIGTGIAQKRRGKKIKPGEKRLSDKRKRALDEAATRRTSTRLAGQDRMEETLEEGGAMALKEATESAMTPQERMAVAGKISSDVSKGKRAIEEKAAQVSEQRAKDYTDELVDYAGEEEDLRSGEIDEQRERKLALESSGAQNIYEGIKGIASTAVGGLTEKSTGEGSRMVEDAPAGRRTGELSDEQMMRRARRSERYKSMGYGDNPEGRSPEEIAEMRRRRNRNRGRRKF